MAGQSLLEVDRLRVGFDAGDRTVEIIRGVSFSVDGEEAVGLVGESGSGKSLTAAAIIQLTGDPVRILGGCVRFAGRDLIGLKPRELAGIRGREISMVFQDPSTSLNPVFSIGTQLSDVIRAHQGVGRRAAADIAAGILASVGIVNPVARLRHYPHELSGGMRQRVMIGMAVACRPKLLILDEPTTALDVTVQAQVMELIRGLKQQLGFAVLFITHNLDLAAEFCDRAMVMYGGEIVEEAPVQALFDTPRHPYSRALLDCVPRLGPRGRSFSSIPGQPPTPGALAAGCAFTPRCGLAFARCHRERPMLHEAGADHRVACFAEPELVKVSQHAIPA